MTKPWICVPLKKAVVAHAASQAKVVIHPVIQLRNAEYFRLASSATQWYWPPEVGYLVLTS
jgi:hypothetical protein